MDSSEWRHEKATSEPPQVHTSEVTLICTGNMNMYMLHVHVLLFVVMLLYVDLLLLLLLYVS